MRYQKLSLVKFTSSCFIVFRVLPLITEAISSDLVGPEFATEPSRINYFINEIGLSLHCIASRGHVTWLDGQLLPLPVYNVDEEQNSSYRRFDSLTVFPNGTLYFPPFSMSDSLRSFYCAVENEIGRILSKEVLVRPVIKEYFDEVRLAADNYITEGNDILLQCNVPETAKSFVRIIAWTKGSENIFPHSTLGSNKYFILPEGELLVENVSIIDIASSFRCRIHNRLTGKYAFSETAARIHLPGDKTSKTAPLISPAGATNIRVKEGRTAVLLCLSNANPPAKHEWVKSNGQGGFDSLHLQSHSSKISIRRSVLIIENVDPGDSGTYICFANNSRGSDRLRIEVVVSPAVTSVELLPKYLTVDAGKTAEFTCWTNMGDDYPHAREIEWRKDGSTKLLQNNWRVSLAGDKLRIVQVSIEDAGMYQCVVKSTLDMAQAYAQLAIGDVQPKFSYKFIEHTISLKGTRVSLKCSAIGNPSPTIEWKVDGFAIPNSERILIGQYVTGNDEVISHVNITTIVSDGGEYSCTATNRVGNVEHKARLNIYGPPLVRNMSTVNAVAGKDFKIKCPVSGYPIDAITFAKDNQMLPFSRRQTVSSDGVLTIKDVEKSTDNGFYSCSAYSKEQSHTNHFRINVVVPPTLAPMGFPHPVVEGERVVVYCVVKAGDIPLQIQWLRDSSPIEPNASFGNDIVTQQIGDDIGLVLIISKVKVAHANANFTCVAKNQHGEDSMELKGMIVHVSPRIAKFSFPDQISEGKKISQRNQVLEFNKERNLINQGHRVQVNCAVDNYPDLPILFVWYKDGDKIIEPEKYFLKIIQVDTFSSMLIIDSVDSKHTGNYTCVAQNFATASFSQELIVRVKPKWISEPEDFKVTEGDSGFTPCHADGNPFPTISWKKRKRGTSLTGVYQDISVHTSQTLPQEIVSFPNGSLYIPNAQTIYSGAYICEAVNGVGAGLSKLVHLEVNVPVRVLLAQNSTTREGQTAVVLCEFSGESPIDVAWYRGFQQINPTLDFRYRIHTAAKNNGKTSSELTITSVRRGDSAQYTCSGSNIHGKDSEYLWLTVQEPPDPPANLFVLSQTSRSVQLGWETTRISNENQFHVKYTNGSGLWTTIAVVPESEKPAGLATSYSVTVGNLEPFTAYQFKVVVKNDVGEKESEKLALTTKGETPEEAPKNIKIKAIDSTQLEVRWDALNKRKWNDEFIAYRVGFKRQSDDVSYKFITLEQTELVLSQLSPFTDYEIVLQAFNNMGPGPMTDPFIEKTWEGVPNSWPEGFTCFALTSQKLQLSWNPLNEKEAQGVLKGYKVFVEVADLEDPDVIDHPLIRTTSTTNLVVGGLSKYTNYSMRVLGFTKVGDGLLSSSIFCRTKEDLPGPPAAIKAVLSNASSLTVSWRPPTNDQVNGQLTKYTAFILWHNSGQETGSIQSRTIPPDITHLEVNMEFISLTVFVSASTRVGDSANTSISFRAPINKHVQTGSIVSFGTKFFTPWKEDIRFPCDAVWSPRNSRTWYKFWEPIGARDRYTLASDGSLIIRDLRREDAGNFTCSIRNIFGVDSITHTLVVQVPPLSPQLFVVGVSHTTLTIQWKVSDFGNAPLKGFILHLKESDEWTEKLISRYSNEFLLTNLICGRNYQMYMTAFNRVGIGSTSRLVNASTLGSIPTFRLASSQLLILHINTTWIRVLVSDVWNSSCPILHYHIMHRDESKKRWIPAAGDDLSLLYKRSVDLMGLTEGTVYTVRVIVTNTAGSNQVQLAVRTLSLGESDNTQIMSNKNKSISAQIQFDWSLVLTLFFTTCIISFTAITICCYLRKKSSSSEINSIKTTSSSNYFKQNSSCDKAYMTVKKTPLHDMRDFSSAPESTDDIYPYATFDLRDDGKDPHYELVDRTKFISERNLCKSQLRNCSSTMESGEEKYVEEEEDDFASESDISEESSFRQHSRIYLYELGNSPGIEFEEKPFHQTNVRCNNTYECVLPTRNCNWQRGNPLARNPTSLHVEDTACGVHSLRKAGKNKTKNRMLLGLANVHQPSSNYHDRLANLKPPKAFCDPNTNCDDD